MPRPRTAPRAPLLAALAGAAAAGCTGLEPAAVSAGATAAQSGISILERGKARSFELARFPDVVDALRRAGERLELRLTTDQADDHRARLVFRDERGESVVAVVERRTGAVTLLQTDVGVFGNVGLATLLMNQVYAELARAGRYTDDWTRASPRQGGAGVQGP